MSHADTRPAARLTALYEAHAADAFRYALHLTGRREDAEDVVQYVFLQAYASLEAGRDLVNPRAWLIKATKHRSLNLIRDRREASAADVDDAAGCAVDPGEAEALAGVRATLWSLPEPQHHAFVLRHWSGLSQNEIADVLATTPGAVESLLVRARATLVAEHDEGDPQCASVRERLVRMVAPTPAHEDHLASCHRCRTAQTRLLRASGFAAALVPTPQVAHALAAAVPGFGVSGAAGTAAAGAGAGGAGTGGAAVSTVSAATKAGIMAKIAVAATTAAVAVTAVHPVRTAVTHALLGAPAARSAATAGQRTPAANTAGPAARNGSGPAATGNGAGAPNGKGTAPGHGKAKGAANGGSGGNGAGKGMSGTAGSNGNGNGNGNGGTPAKGSSASAPGKTKGAGSKPATGKGQTKRASTTKPSPPTGGGNGNGNAGGNGNGNGNGNAGGNGKGSGKP